MRRVPAYLLQSGLLLALLAIPACGSGESPHADEATATAKSPRRNVLLISIDSLRRDHVGVYGHRPEFAPEIPVSPTLDALAQEGVVFDDAWTTTSWTLPAHMSLMTGLSDRRHGVEMDGFRLDPLRRTLAEAFHDQGFRTAGYFSGPFLDPKHGFGRGFDDYRSGMLSAEDFAADIQRRNEARLAAGQPPLDERFVRQMRDRISHWDITSPRIEKMAEDFLAAEDERPFFLFLHFFDAHYDYIPWSMDPALAQAFDPDYSGPFDGSNWYFDERVMGTGPDYSRLIGDRDLAHIRANYDAEIHWVDQHLAAIFADLKARGLWEDTVIMVVSDHGDEFFEHNSIGHRSTLFAEQCRIPMIMRVPGEIPGGRRISALSRIYDVAPTLLDYAGAIPTQDLPEAEGSSLRAVVDGEETEGRFALQRIYSGGHRRSRRLNIRDGYRDRRWTVLRQLSFDEAASRPDAKAVKVLTRRSDNSPFLVFDRQQDPQELAPLAVADPRFSEAVDAFCRAFTASEQEAAELRQSPLEDRLAAAMTAEERAALDALGYVDGGADEGSGTPEVLPLLPFPSPCPPR